MSSEKKREWIPTALRREVMSRPCVICGIPFGIHCDHIVPVVMGGRSVKENLQPLCRDCNYTKKHLKTTSEAKLVIASRGAMHFLNAFYRHGTRYCGYDRPRMSDWIASHPEETAEAVRLFEKFCGGTDA